MPPAELAVAVTLLQEGASLHEPAAVIALVATRGAKAAVAEVRSNETACRALLDGVRVGQSEGSPAPSTCRAESRGDRAPRIERVERRPTLPLDGTPAQHAGAASVG